MCTLFDSKQYHQVQIAYRLLGKSQVSYEYIYVCICILCI